MSFALDINTYLLCSLFNVDRNKLTNEYYGMTIQQIMAAEAKSGNKEATTFDASILNNPKKLVDLFALKDPGNKYKILSNMNENDLDELLPYLSQQDLVQGLNFFNKDKLLDMMQQLPIEQLVNYTLQMFSPEHLMQFMPEQELDKVLMSKQVNKKDELGVVKTLDPAILTKMYIGATGLVPEGVSTGGASGKTKIDGQKVYKQIASLPDDLFQAAMLSLPPAHKQGVVASLCEMNPKLYNEIDPKAYTKAIGMKQSKQDMLLHAGVLGHDSLVAMNMQLPKELTSVVLTQISTDIFAKQLSANFKDVLSQVIAA